MSIIEVSGLLGKIYAVVGACLLIVRKKYMKGFGITTTCMAGDVTSVSNFLNSPSPLYKFPHSSLSHQTITYINRSNIDLNGTYYDGEFLVGSKHGHGKLSWQDGSYYEGQFKRNMFEGKGTYVWSTLNKYEGNFKNGKMDGIGTFTWADGKVYYGEFKNGLREGKGVCKWPDGKVYDGKWKQGKQHGQGTFTDSQGKSRKGIISDGEKVKWLN